MSIIRDMLSDELEKRGYNIVPILPHALRSRDYEYVCIHLCGAHYLDVLIKDGWIRFVHCNTGYSAKSPRLELDEIFNIADPGFSEESVIDTIEWITKGIKTRIPDWEE